MTYYDIEDGLLKGKMYYRKAWNRGQYLFFMPSRKMNSIDVHHSNYPTNVKSFMQDIINYNGKQLCTMGYLYTINVDGNIIEGYTLHYSDITSNDWQEFNHISQC